MRKKLTLNKTSEKNINKFLNYVNMGDEFNIEFNNLLINEVKLLKDCSEKSIVDFYINQCKKMLIENLDIDDNFWNKLKEKTRMKLSVKYTSNKTFDNNIDIYFNEVKREYILHPIGESDDMIFVPENRDIFIKNNLKLVIDCAKRYQNLGLPFEDLIQIGNYGLLLAFDKFDSDRANLRVSILNSIKSSKKSEFSKDDIINIIKDNFSYTKILDATIKKIPENGFKSKDEFINWTNANIKKASFSSIGFIWVRAMILIELNKLSKIIRVPKSANKESNSLNVIRLDSINPHTMDCYHDNQTSDITNEDFIIEDESIENIEKQNIFKELLNKSLLKLSSLENRIIKKRFGIDLPYQLSINEIAENEGLSTNKVKYIINNALKIIGNNIKGKDKQTILELLR